MVDEKEEVHSEVLDRFKADKEGREAWKLEVREGVDACACGCARARVWVWV